MGHLCEPLSVEEQPATFEQSHERIPGTWWKAAKQLGEHLELFLTNGDGMPEHLLHSADNKRSIEELKNVRLFLCRRTESSQAIIWYVEGRKQLGFDEDQVVLGDTNEFIAFALPQYHQ